MPKRIIDITLIRDILNGNKNAFHYITDEYYDVILYHIFRIVKDKEEARDLTNDVFVKVFNNLSLYNEKHSFNAWIYKIATNEAIDYLRKKKIQKDSIKEDLNVIEENNPESKLVNKENYATLTEAINKLKPTYRLIIKMRYFEELSYEEIASKLSMPIGTIKAYLHRAKAMLIKIIQNQLP